MLLWSLSTYVPYSSRSIMRLQHAGLLAALFPWGVQLPSSLPRQPSLLSSVLLILGSLQAWRPFSDETQEDTTGRSYPRHPQTESPSSSVLSFQKGLGGTEQPQFKRRGKAWISDLKL